MRNRAIKGILTLAVGVAMAAGAAAQGKHGDKGNGHGNGNGGGNGQGQEKHAEKQWQGDRGRGEDKHEFKQERRQQEQVYQQQRQYQQQVQRQNDWNAQRQQQQNEQNIRRQQQQVYQQQRQYQQQNDWNARQQRLQAYEQQRQYRQQNNVRSDYDTWGEKWQKENEKRLRKENKAIQKGWNNGFPPGNAYGLRGIWPGEFRGTRDLERQARGSERDARRYNQYSQYGGNNYSGDLYRVYQQQYYNNNYVYQQPYRSTQNRVSSGDQFFRTIIGMFFNEPAYSGNSNYYPTQQYGSYSPAYDNGVNSGYGSYNTSYSPYYAQPSYSPYYDNSYGAGNIDPYFGSSYYDDPNYGNGGLKSTLLSFAGEMLQGLLGQGYLQGLDQGQYARTRGYRNTTNYVDPYAYDEFSPMASATTLDEQRRLLSEGYRLGYRDAMQNRDPYNADQFGGGVDLVSVLIGNTLNTFAS